MSRVIEQGVRMRVLTFYVVTQKKRVSKCRIVISEVCHDNTMNVDCCLLSAAINFYISVSRTASTSSFLYSPYLILRSFKLVMPCDESRLTTRRRPHSFV